MKFFLSCLIGHVLLARLIPYPWWIPNLTATGLTLATINAPSRWPIYATTAGLALTIWMPHDRTRLFMTVLVLGWLVKWVAGRWQATDRRVQAITIAALTAAMALGTIKWQATSSWRLLGMALLQTAMTVLSSGLLMALIRAKHDDTD